MKDVLTKLTDLAATLKMLIERCPSCLGNIHELQIGVVRIDSSVKSSHHRIDGLAEEVKAVEKTLSSKDEKIEELIAVTKKDIFWTAGLVVATATMVWNGIIFFVERFGK